MICSFYQSVHQAGQTLTVSNSSVVSHLAKHNKFQADMRPADREARLSLVVAFSPSQPELTRKPLRYTRHRLSQQSTTWAHLSCCRPLLRFEKALCQDKTSKARSRDIIKAGLILPQKGGILERFLLKKGWGGERKPSF